MGRHFSAMIKPASSLCNLRCRYCFYEDVSDLRAVKSCGMMAEDTARAVIGHVFAGLAADDSVGFCFQGGEPTLAGLAFFERFVELVDEENARRAVAAAVDYSLQTNGLLLDEAWCRFLHKNHFLVGLSLDGDEKLHDQNRVHQDGSGSYREVSRAKRLLETHKVPFNILWVLTGSAAAHPQKIWRFLKRERIGFVQFVPCLSGLEEGSSRYALSPEQFADFYTELFRLWAEELRGGHYISVKFFDDLFNLLLRRTVTACGFTGACSVQIVVEADGSMYPCDFYALDEWRLGSLADTDVEKLLTCEKAQAFLERPRPVSALCGDCRWFSICRGGCPRMKESMYADRSGKVCGYKAFLDKNAPMINRVAAELARMG